MSGKAWAIYFLVCVAACWLLKQLKEEPIQPPEPYSVPSAHESGMPTGWYRDPATGVRERYGDMRAEHYIPPPPKLRPEVEAAIQLPPR